MHLRKDGLLRWTAAPDQHARLDAPEEGELIRPGGAHDPLAHAFASTHPSRDRPGRPAAGIDSQSCRLLRTSFPEAPKGAGSDVFVYLLEPKRCCGRALSAGELPP